MSMYQPQKKHKARHGNYAVKPTQGQVNRLIDLYAGIADVKLPAIQEKEVVPAGHQFKMKF